MLRPALGRFRLVGFLEGLSYLLLLFVAMPLKYLAGEPGLVRIVGWAHGVLFVLYIAAALHAAVACRWSFLRLGAAFAASLLPFGPFVFDRKLPPEDQPVTSTEP